MIFNPAMIAAGGSGPETATLSVTLNGQHHGGFGYLSYNAESKTLTAKEVAMNDASNTQTVTVQDAVFGSILYVWMTGGYFNYATVTGLNEMINTTDRLHLFSDQNNYNGWAEVVSITEKTAQITW